MSPQWLFENKKIFEMNALHTVISQIIFMSIMTFDNILLIYIKI